MRREQRSGKGNLHALQHVQVIVVDSEKEQKRDLHSVEDGLEVHILCGEAFP